MLSREQVFFLSVLADHLNGRPGSPAAGLDWKSVYDMAARHRVSAIFYAQCGAFLPPEAELPFLRDYGTAVTDYAARQQMVSGIDREFTRHGIPYIVVKGLAVAECYPQPELRTMSDVDIIVKEEDKEQAHSILLELGFQNVLKQSSEWNYRKDSYKIELHHRLLYDTPNNAPSSRILADRVWEYARPVPGSSRCELECNFHFLYLVMHLKKHLLFRGAGFRQFMDLAATAQNWPLNWRKLESWLTETDLFLFVRISLMFCREWFRMDFPIAAEKLAPEFAEDMVQQIFRNGVFGYDDKSNADNYTIVELECRNGDSLSSRLQLCREKLLPASPDPGASPSFLHFIRIFFPDYEYMRKLQNSRFIDGHPWLLPAGWIWRFVLGAKNRILQIMMIALLSRKKVRKRRKNLDRMGL